MRKIHCECCQKYTAHKAIMVRTDNQHDTLFQSFSRFISAVIQGDHYVNMEQQYYCRTCNHQSEGRVVSLPNAKAA
ncbi:hypothetical protein [Vibrio renipiscarius]|uniref:Uncharacterized protein n=1 Tax=Vibrio renipiscarius TaxID=1461322 RepID=A0A0C2K2T0_9VIBR|nr:hypothetical protein [Vibrio renipiscarius]KII76273.1 hypothetical protein OJ16_15815 [Vibrio renipiscarius]KII78205.1 hypothetical protein PL18_14755 [Vibrio renipiscarius]